MYRAFVDNYKVAVETADKCCQANAQFAEISEVCAVGPQRSRLCCLRQVMTGQFSLALTAAAVSQARCGLTRVFVFFFSLLSQDLKVKSTKDCKDQSAKYSLESEY